jgi:hypothetical protein
MNRINTDNKFSRRTLLKFGAAGAFFLLLSEWKIARLFSSQKSEPKGALSLRTESVYNQDRKYPLRKSQDNPEVKAIYAEFLGHPCSEKSHHLLHTHYIDRSAKIKELRKQGLIKF